MRGSSRSSVKETVVAEEHDPTPAVGDGFEEFRRGQRRAIAAALIAVVTEGGIAAANVSELVRELKMSRKTFYKYFSSIEEALVYAQELVLADFETASAANGETGADRFVAGLRRLVTLALDDPARMRFLGFFDYAVRDYRMGAAARAEYDDFTAELVSPPLASFRAGQRDGSIRA
ncbi:MAG TPA: TetR family transcriptional regulator, partial [Protaetiibacter sp.]|nr:TetR family transcriptional regulator [Protaetiibacter sp.]